MRSMLLTLRKNRRKFTKEIEKEKKQIYLKIQITKLLQDFYITQ